MTEPSTHQATLGEINREFFNANIEKVDAEWIQVVQQQILDWIQHHIEWLGIRKPSTKASPVKMLDYACGTGIASRALASQVEIIRGIDVSDAMVNRFNKAASSAGFSGKQMHAIRGDFLSDAYSSQPEDETDMTINSKDFFDFDIVVISLALHHVSDPQILVKRLVERLIVGGTVLIIDGTPLEQEQLEQLIEAQKHQHGAMNMPSQARHISRFGFDAAEMRTFLLDAGCSESSIEYLENEEVSKIPEDVTGIKGGMKNALFFAKGKKA